MLKLDQITRLHVELTTKCNARCPMCPRNYRGMDYNAGYPNTELDLDKFRKIFPTKFLQQIKHIQFNGNLGDAAMASDLKPILEYVFATCDSTVTITTNASLRTCQWWANLVNPKLEIMFDLDGLRDTHGLYRLDTDWNKIIANAEAFIQAGGNAVWKMILFDHNRHQIEDCRRLSQKLGFKNFWLVDYGRNQGPVYTRQGNFSHWLGPKNETVPDLTESLLEHVTWFDTKPSREWGIDETVEIDCQHIKNKELYVAADGSVYPCCFLGFYPGTMKHPGNSQIKSLAKKNNALEYDLEECVDWFNDVEQSWRCSTIDQGRLYSCVTSCGVKR